MCGRFQRRKFTFIIIGTIEGVIIAFFLLSPPRHLVDVRIAQNTNISHCLLLISSTEKRCTERGGSVLTHESLIREVPGSNPVAGHPG